jgi:hypothetical protein
MTWSPATAVVGSAVVTLAYAEFGSFVAIEKRPETAGWRLAPAGVTKEAALLVQLSPRRRRAVKGTWPRRSPERGQFDRLFLS